MLNAHSLPQRGFDRPTGAGYHTACKRNCHVIQYLRPSLPGHDLRRKPRAGDRLRGRRLSAAHSADRGRYPAVSRQAAAGAVALHHPAAGAGHGQNPVRRVRRRGERPAGDDRHADRAADRERRPALEGLFRDQGRLPAGPCRLHLRRQIRLPRLSRRRPRLGARDRDAGRGRRHRPQDRAGAQRARRADPDGPAQDRPRALGLGRGRAQSVLLSRTPRRPRASPTISTACARTAPRSAP